MSANVQRSAGTGELPWWIGLHGEDHGQFTHLGQENVTAEAICKAAGLDYTVAKSPMFTYPTKEHFARKEAKKVEGKYAIIRSDTYEPLSDVCVGRGYTPIQNAENFDVMDHLTGQMGAAHYTQAGALNSGIYWANAVLNKSLYIAGDELKTYLLATWSHDGTSSNKFFVTPTRTVCENTYRAALRDAQSSTAIRHTKNYRDKIEQAKRLLGLTEKYMVEFEDFANSMLAMKVPSPKADGGAFIQKFVDMLLPVPEDATMRQITNVNDERRKFARAFTAPDLENFRFTGWGLLSAVTDYSQHRREIRGAKDDETKLSRLFERSFLDNELLEKAKDFLLAVR